MLLNLEILPLTEAGSFLTQKCLISRKYLTNTLLAGSWVKCYWSEDSYAICQLFPKDAELTDHNSCYMNTNVSNGISIEIPEKLVKLEKILPCEATSVDLVVELNEEDFILHSKRYKRNYVQSVIQALLQPLHLAIGCQIKTQDLLQTGIAGISIIAAANIDMKCVFSITDSTQLHLKDIRIISVVNKTEKHLIKFDFLLSYVELQELLQLAKRQQQILTQPKPRRRRIPLNALVVGGKGCGKSMLLKTVLAEEHCNCFAITASKVLGQYPGETESNIRQIFEAAQYFDKWLQPKELTVVLLEDLHLLCPAAQGTGADACNAMRICAQVMCLMDRLQQMNANILCIATTTSTDSLAAIVQRPGRFEREIIVAPPNEQVRAHLLNKLFASQPEPNLKSHITAEFSDFIVKRTQGYVIADLALLAQSITQTMLRKNKDEEKNLFAIIKSTLSKSTSSSLKASDITVIKPTENFASIAGMSKLKTDLQISLLAAYKQQRAFARFGLHVPKGLLLYGPPGCGKTKFAKCIAYEANMTLITTSGAEVYSPYVGVAEKFIGRIFDTARRHAPCLIFFDEIDTLVGKRTTDSGQQNDVQLRILSTLLTEMDGIMHATSMSTLNNHSDIMVVAATNRPDMLDDALIRPGRFDKLIHVPPPDYQSRIDLLMLHAKSQPFAADVNFDKLAASTQNFSGADLTNLCNEAALHALQLNENAVEIKASDFDDVLQTLKPSLTTEQIQKYFTIENSNQF